MKHIILTLMLAMMATIPFNTKANDDAKAPIYAVKFHADWCGSCQKIAPQLAKARGKHDLDSKNVLFVTLDLTNKLTTNQATLLANAIGLGELYAANDGKTGFMLLVDSESKETLGKITKDMNADDITALISEKTGS